MAAEYEVNIKINTQQIERELKKVDKAVNNIGKGKGGKKQPILALPSTEMLNATARKIQSLDNVNRKIALRQREINKQTRDQALSIDTLVKTQEKRARLLNKINEMEAKGLNVSRLRKQLAKATTEQSARRFGSAEKEFRVLEKSIRLEQSKLRILKEQRKGFAFSPVRGTRTMMGSPAQIAASGRQRVSPIGGRIDIAGSPAQMEAIRKVEMAEMRADKNAHFAELKLIQQRQKIQLDSVDKLFRANERELEKFNRKLEAADKARQKRLAGATVSKTPFGPAGSFPQVLGGLPTGGAALPIRGSISMPGSPIAVQAAKATNLRAIKVEASWAQALGELQETAGMLKMKDTRIKQSWSTALAELNETASLLRVRSQQANAGLTGQSSPIGGATNIPGSPAFLRRQQRIKTLEQVGLGAGFPLLFGGGAGSILGGGLGGLTGSFGAQIAFSAIGQQIDQFVAGMVDAGKALTSVGGAADFMAEKSLFSSDAMQFRIEKLIEDGRVTEAAALMTQEMAKQVGGSGLKALKDLGDEANKMGKLFNALILQVQAFISKALTPLLAAINKVVGDVVLNNQFNALMGEATGARAKEIEEFLKPFTRRVRKGAAAKDVVTSEGKRLAVERFGGQMIPEGAAIEPSTLETLSAADSRAGDMAKDQQRLADIARKAQERLQIMQQEGDLAKELKKLDFERAAEIKKINKLEFASTEAREKAIKATNELFDARKGEEIGKALGKDLQTAMALKKAQDDVLRPLEDQRRLLEAKLNGNEEEVRLNLQVESIMRSVKGLKKEDVENVVKGNALLTEQVAVVEKLDQVYASIGQSITTGIVDALTSAVEGTKSLADVAGQTLRQVANILLQFGVQTALSGIPGLDKFFPGRALGGSVSANKPYMVGERGPELFVPGAQGNVVPNNALGGANVVVNVDASGTQAQGNQPNAKALGAAIGAAVQAELVKQKRPGGLLS